MDFVLTALSARNHGLLDPLKEIYVYTKGCSTYTLPREIAEEVGLGSHAAHPQVFSLFFFSVSQQVHFLILTVPRC